MELEWDSFPHWKMQMDIFGWAITANTGAGAEPPRQAMRNPAVLLELRGEVGTHYWDKQIEAQRWKFGKQIPIPPWMGLFYLPPSWVHQALDEEAVILAAEEVIDEVPR